MLIPSYLKTLAFEDALPKWVLGMGIAVWDYFAPNVSPGVAWATFGLIVLDTITGVVAAKISGEEITSAKMGRFFTKVVSYALGVALIAFAVNAVPLENAEAGAKSIQNFLMTTLLAGIAATEIKSNLENLAKMGYELPAPVTKWLADGAQKLAPKNKQED